MLLLLPGSTQATAFDILILEKFGSTIPAGVRYLVERVLAPSFPQLAPLWRFRDEVVAAILLNLQHTLLTRSSGTIEEVLYGWTRVSARRNAGADSGDGRPVARDRRRVWLSLVGAVLIPYLRQKLETWHEARQVELQRSGGTGNVNVMTPDIPVTGANQSENSSFARHVLGLLHAVQRTLAVSLSSLHATAAAAAPALIAALDALQLVFLLAHAMGLGGDAGLPALPPSPWLALAGVRLARPAAAAAAAAAAAGAAAAAPNDAPSADIADTSAPAVAPAADLPALSPGGLPSAGVPTDAAAAAATAHARPLASVADRLLLAARVAAIAALIALKVYQWVAAARAARAAASGARPARTARVRPPAWTAVPPPPPELSDMVEAAGEAKGAAESTGGRRGLAAVVAQYGGRCPLCGSAPSAPTATPAGVVYCRACIVDYLSQSAVGEASGSEDAHGVLQPTAAPLLGLGDAAAAGGGLGRGATATLRARRVNVGPGFFANSTASASDAASEAGSLANARHLRLPVLVQPPSASAVPRCPVSGVPCTVADLRRLFEVM